MHGGCWLGSRDITAVRFEILEQVAKGTNRGGERDYLIMDLKGWEFWVNEAHHWRGSIMRCSKS